MEKKYKLTDTKIVYKGKTLYEIIALKDFGDVKKGEKGGWIESESNLSHKGNCWVSDNAYVYGGARVLDNAQIYGKAEVFGEVRIHDDVEVYEYAQVSGNVHLFNRVQVYCGAKISGKTVLCDDIEVCGYATIDADVVFRGDAFIESDSDFEVFRNNWSSGVQFAYTKVDKKWTVDTFHGTGEELIKEAYKRSELDGKMYEKYVRFIEPAPWFTRLKNLICELL